MRGMRYPADASGDSLAAADAFHGVDRVAPADECSESERRVRESFTSSGMMLDLVPPVDGADGDDGGIERGASRG